MSNAQKFIDKICTNPELKGKCLQHYKNKDDAAIRKLSQDAGFPCTYQDLDAIFKERTFAKELSDEDLLKISAANSGEKYH